MSIMDWEPALDVGVGAMNDEHKQLLSLMNALHDAYKAGETGSSVMQKLDALGAATIKHFADEEVYMESIGYPKLASHKIIHQQLLQKFTQFSAEIRQANGKLEEGFFTFLKFWLSAHIKGVDMQYSPAAMKMTG